MGMPGTSPSRVSRAKDLHFCLRRPSYCFGTRPFPLFPFRSSTRFRLRKPSPSPQPPRSNRSRRLLPEGGGPVIRQAISCDICGTDKRQTNHWFVAYEHGSELRIADWSSPRRLHPRAKHLCGQTCLHKLVDEFFAQMLASSAPLADEDIARAEPGAANRLPARTDASLTSRAAHALPAGHSAPSSDLRGKEPESSAHLLVPASRNAITSTEPSPPGFNTKAWQAEAWKREKERTQRSTLEAGAKRRRSIA
jgi:hypothetical protein